MPHDSGQHSRAKPFSKFSQLETPGGASARVVVDEIVATTRQARAVRAVCDIFTSALVIGSDYLLKAAVALTLIVILVNARGLRIVNTHPISGAYVALAIVIVNAPSMLRNRPRRRTGCVKKPSGAYKRASQ